MMGKSDLTNKSVLSDVLRQLRVSHNLTQTKVAAYLNIDRSTYTKYENGREPDLNSLKKLAELYDVSIDELVSGEYSEEIGKIIVAKNTMKESGDADFFPLSDDEKKLISYFRTCSRPKTILRFAKNLYRDDILDTNEDD